MKIYTKTGDEGDTSLLGGMRVPKSSLRIEAYGTVDELNSVLGVVRTLHPSPEIADELLSIQKELFILGADLAAPMTVSKPIQRIEEIHAHRLETIIDRFDVRIPPLRNFILPGGTQAAAELHKARTICRRAERRVDALHRQEPLNRWSLIYLNRLADLLFVLARVDNHISGHQEEPWISE